MSHRKVRSPGTAPPRAACLRPMPATCHAGVGLRSLLARCAVGSGMRVVRGAIHRARRA